MNRILCVLGLLGCFFVLTSLSPGKKKLKGTLHLSTGIFDQVKGDAPCRLDSAAGFVVEFVQEVENPLFESKSKNQVQLYAWFGGAPIPKKRYYVPSEDCKGLCYRESGDLLMFETFQGSGWIELGEFGKKGRIGGIIDLKLVEPHHNFSNSDFHYLGGEFELRSSAEAN